MAFKDTKIAGNPILSDDWNAFVDFTEATSSNAYRTSSNYSSHKANTTIHLTSILITTPISGSALVWNGSNWVDRGKVITV